MENQRISGKMVLIGLQHVFAMFGCTVLVPLLTGLSTTTTLLCAGVGTLLFHWITGGKVPVFLGSSFSFMAGITAVSVTMAKRIDPAFVAEGKYQSAAAYQAALPYATGAIIVAGAIYLVLALLVKLIGTKRFLRAFPPIVTGPTVIVIGLYLAPTAISSITTASPNVGVNWLIALVSVAIIIVVSLFCKGFFKLVPILFGIVGGYVFAALLGQTNLSGVVTAPWISVPQIMLPKFDIGAIFMVAPLALVTFAEHVADISASSAVCGKNFLEDPGLPRTLIGDGVATMFAGLIGGPANTTYSENTGVLAATKNYDPRTLRIAAIFAILLSFLGKFGALLQAMPWSVIGGVSIILYGMITAVGLRTLVENKVDFTHTRNLLIVAVMLVLGLGCHSINLTDTISVSGIAIAAISGFILNLVLPQHIEPEEGAEA